MVRLDQGQREINAGRDASRRPDGTVRHEDAVGFDLRCGEAPLQVVRTGPMRRDAATVKQPYLAQKERPSAHAGDTPRLRGQTFESRSSQASKLVRVSAISSNNMVADSDAASRICQAAIVRRRSYVDDCERDCPKIGLPLVES